MKRQFILNTTGLLAALLVITVSAAAQTYVAVSGADSNPCSAALPCRTIQRALGVLPPGGTVTVAETGDYDPFLITGSATVKAASGITAQIVYRWPRLAAITINPFAPSSVVKLEGLTLKSESGDGIGVLYQNGSSLNIHGCLIRGFHKGILVRERCLLTISDTAVIGPPSCGDSTGIELASLRANFPIQGTIERTKVYNHAHGLVAVGTTNVRAIESAFAYNTRVGVTVYSDGTSGTAAQLELKGCYVFKNGEIGVAAGLPATPAPAAVIKLSSTWVSHNGGSAGVYINAGVVCDGGGNAIFGNSAVNVFGVLSPPC